MRMVWRTPFLALALIGGLAACDSGGRDRAALVSAFTEAGLDESTSNCMAEKASADMDPELYDALLEAAKSEDDSLDALTPLQQAEFGTFMLNAALGCADL